MENNATAKHEASTHKLRRNLEEQPKTVENGKKNDQFYHKADQGEKSMSNSAENVVLYL